MIQQETDSGGLTPLEQWNMLVQELLNRGYSTLNAYDQVHSDHPGLWLVAVAESQRVVDAVRG